MKYLVNIVFLLLSLSVFSQVYSIKGIVTGEDKKEVSFAAIVSQKTGKGTISDEFGNFKMNLSSLNDTLLVSVLGYENIKYPLQEINQDESIKIIIQRKSFVLREITVKPLDPIEVLKKVVQELPNNLPSVKHNYDAFFRQFHKEEGRAVRLIECALNVYHPRNSFSISSGIKEKIKVLNLRRSNVYEQNGDEHDNHLNDMLLQNIAYYPNGTVLNPKGWNYYKFKLHYPSQDNDHVIISYTYENSDDIKLEFGTLHIDLSDFSIISVNQESIMNINYFSINHATNSWKYLKGSLSISYKKINGKIYTDSISYYYKHNVTSKKHLGRIFTVEEYFDFYAGDISNLINNGKEYKQIQNLYTKKYEYEEAFWAAYPLLLKHPVLQDWKVELEKNESLHMQFKKNERFKIN